MSLFENIASEIAGRIRRGTYKPGDKISSIRDLAHEFGCNKITMKKAFDVLKFQGLIENRVGSGSFVRYPEYLPEPATAYDFKNAYISPHLFPYKKFGEIFTKIMERDGASAFAQPPVKGMTGLIESAAQFYNLPSDRMIIVSGAQQGIDIARKALRLDPSLPAILEDPTYPGASSLFRPSLPVPVEENGPSLDVFSRLARENRGTVFYAMPAVHNPTGFSYSPEVLGKAAQIIEDNGLFVIEDDYDSEFVRHRGTRFVDIIPARTIYIKSLSKTLSSGIRLGLMISPEELYERVLLSKYKTDIATSGLSQRLVDAFIRDGGYSSFIKSVSLEIERRRVLTFEMLSKRKELSFSQNTSGYNIWVKSSVLPGGSAPPWTPGERFSYSTGASSCFRLSLMNISTEDFDEALGFLESYLCTALS